MDKKNMNIPKEKFNFVQNDRAIQDVKFDTKPIGYFKDAWLRFKKNKSSLAAAYIIIFLLLFAILGQTFSRYEVTYKDGYYSKTLPKNNALLWTGWDGCKKFSASQAQYDIYSSIGVEIDEDRNNVDASPVADYYGTVTTLSGGINHKIKLDSYKKVGFKYINVDSETYYRIQAYQNATNIQIMFPIPVYLDATTNANLWYMLNEEEQLSLYSNAKNSKLDEVIYTGLAAKDEDGNFVKAYNGTTDYHFANYYSLRLAGETTVNEDGETVGNYTFSQPVFAKKKVNGKYVFETDAETGEIVYETKENNYYRYAQKNQTGYKIRVIYYEYYKFLNTEFTYDGDTEDIYTLEKDRANIEGIIDNFSFNFDSGFYPRFLFGTNDKGKDIFTLLSNGARLSFILAISVSAINLFLGAIYGAIEGYYGGTIDLIMERVSDVLSGVPFMVVATLFNLHLAAKVGTLACLLFAFVLTGWIGMASRVRMQFYRFKGQEYVLSARTLGAKDARIMFKHIFPNAIGTIITGSVLSIPGVIFSESMLSYLNIINLETSGFTSVGTLLSNGSKFVSTDPHIILFPALFIALLMISFNLFGNGLRDAFNPSLRGTEE